MSPQYGLLSAGSRFRAKLVFLAMTAGLFAGSASILYRFLFQHAERFALSVLNNIPSIPAILLWGTVAVLIGVLLDAEPLAMGSGIPQVQGEVLRQISMNWRRVMAAKFLGGTAAAALGLSMGRQGPSVQIGASAGKAVAVMAGRSGMEEKILLTCGASAGLSAAFNAPLSGVVFALEEIHRSFSPLVLLSAMVASLTADFLSKNFFGVGHVFSLGTASPMPLGMYGHFVLLGCLCGVGGALFCRITLAAQGFFARLPFPRRYRIILPAMGAVAAAYFLPEILGGGQSLVESLGKGSRSFGVLLLLFSGKVLFTALSSGSGAPGGIFLPMLSAGAVLGALYGTGASALLGTGTAWRVNFLVAGMAGFFTAVVRTPITGILLITEMTGSLSGLLPVSAVALAAHMTAGLLRARPVYESLLLRFLRKSGSRGEPGRILLEVSICPGSVLDGITVAEAPLPRGCLLVAISRAGGDILPRGDTLLSGGDRLTALADASAARHVRAKLLELAANPAVCGASPAAAPGPPPP